MSAADLFAPSSPKRLVTAGSGPAIEDASREDSVDHVTQSLTLSESGLDFSKQPIRVIPHEQPQSHGKESVALPGSTGETGDSSSRPRTTSYSSLLSASKPNTPAPASLSVPRSARTSATVEGYSFPSPTPPSRFFHRHTQSLSAANDVVACYDTGGTDTSVLAASHAKFAAALTAAASNGAHRVSKPLAQGKAAFREAMRLAENEEAIELSDEEMGGDDQNQRYQDPRLQITKNSASVPDTQSGLPESMPEQPHHDSSATYGLQTFRTVKHPGIVEVRQHLEPSPSRDRRSCNSSEESGTTIPTVSTEDETFSNNVSVW